MTTPTESFLLCDITYLRAQGLGGGHLSGGSGIYYSIYHRTPYTVKSMNMTLLASQDVVLFNILGRMQAIFMSLDPFS